MTLQQLKYVQAVASEGHFGKAAERCRVAQPTLSMQIKKLEHALGTELFDRTASPVQTTEVGDQLVVAASHILGELDGFSDWMTGATENVTGVLKLAVLPTLAPTLLPRLMPGLLSRLPELDVSVSERTTANMLEGLQKGDIDVGILVTPLGQNTLRTSPLFMEPLLAYVHPDHSAAKIKDGHLRPEDLPVESMLLLEEGHCFRSQVLQLCGVPERGSALGYTCESGSIETLKRLVRNSGGCTLIPGLEAIEHKEDEAIRRFQEPQPAREVSLIVRPNFHREALLHKLKETIQSAVPASFHAFPSYKRIPWAKLA